MFWNCFDFFVLSISFCFVLFVCLFVCFFCFFKKYCYFYYNNLLRKLNSLVFPMIYRISNSPMMFRRSVRQEYFVVSLLMHPLISKIYSRTPKPLIKSARESNSTSLWMSWIIPCSCSKLKWKLVIFILYC